MKKKTWEIICISFFALLSLVIFKPYFLEHKVPVNGNLLISFFQPWASYEFGGYRVGPPSKPIGFDTLRMYYPIRKLVTQHYKQGVLPLWNPYQFSGNVLLGTFQAATFFPLGILFLFLPQIDAWSITVALEPFLGAFFMYLFLKQIISDKKACFFGALTFGFSGMLICWWEEMFMAGYSVILFPLILYGIEKIYQKVRVSSFLILFSAILISLSTGWFQMIFYSWVFAFAWILFRYFSARNKKALLIVLFCFFLALLVSGVHLLPSTEAFMHSSRSITDAKGDFQTYLMPLYHVVSFVAPDYLGNPAFYNFYGRGFYHESVLYIGIAGFILALYELFSFGKKQSTERFFKIAWIFFLSLGFSLPTSWFLLYTLKIPLVSTLQPSRIFFVAAFCASVLAAFGMQRYLAEDKKKKQLISAILIAGLMLTSVWLYVHYFKTKITIFEIKNAQTTIRNLVLPVILFAITALTLLTGLFGKKIKKVAFIVLIGITTIGIFYFAQKYLYFSQKSFVFPPVPVLTQLKKISGIDRFLGVGEGYIETNFATYQNLYSSDGYESFNNERYGQLVYSSHTSGKYSEKMSRSDVGIMKSPNLADSLSNPYRKRMISLLGIKYLVEKHGDKDFTNDITNDGSVKLVWTDGVFNIYKNTNALPRTFFVYDYVLLQQRQQILDKIYNLKTDLSKTAILEQSPTLPLDKNGAGTVRVVSYSPEDIHLDATTSENGILLITDNYYPGWKAFVDGKEVPIMRTDYTFRSITVPKGNHKIIFTYQPISLLLGIYVSIFGIVLLLGTIYVLKKRILASY